MVKTFITENDFGVGEVRSWASLLDDNCRLQAEMISRVPIIDGYLALMPDAHHGFGPPVGSALITKNAVMPYAVGVDIGCGMIAIKTDLQREEFVGKERTLLGAIREYIPSGVGHGHAHQSVSSLQFFENTEVPYSIASNEALLHTAKMQFGTLGSGNHFVEVCHEVGGNTVWFVLHSGSRGVGNQVATRHVRKAQVKSRRENLEHTDFAYFHDSEPEFAEYIEDMLWCQEYAFEQREAMAKALSYAVEESIGSFSILDKINCHHNYAENLGEGRWLTRKGAIDASVGKKGVIPGSMGAATYIVEGLGNAESYNTSPHGAGRLLGRNVAKKQLSLEEFKVQMEGKTWLDRDAQKLLDEAPHAYKPIETVIADSAELITPITVLSQFINYKGL